MAREDHGAKNLVGSPDLLSLFLDQDDATDREVWFLNLDNEALLPGTFAASSP